MPEERKLFQKCQRCSNWYEPDLEQCPYCAPYPPVDRHSQPHGKFEREKQAIKRSGAPLIIVSTVIAAIPTCALLDFVWNALYQFFYGAYLNDLSQDGAHELAQMTADRLLLFAFVAIWAAIAYIIHRLIATLTNRTAAKEAESADGAA